MFLYSPVMVDSTSASKWRFQICEQSVTANMTDTLRASLSHECEMEGLTPPQSGQTLEHSTGELGVDTWILSLAVSRAKMCQSQENEMESLRGTEAASGFTSLGSLARYDRDSHSLKTSQDSLPMDLTESSVSLPRWGMMRSGVLFRRQTLRLITKESESGFLPTPTNNMTSGGANHNSPTVKAGKHGLNLKGFAQIYPTPRAFMHKDSTTDRGKGNLGEVIGGQLNPQWVAWLMGLPTEWTNLDSSVMEWFRNRPRSRSKSSAKESAND